MRLPKERREVEGEVSHATGGCACGAVRYEVSAQALMAAICHCRDCQRTGGGPYAGHSFVPAGGFQLTKGAPAVYETRSDSGHKVSRFFCRGCGSPLYAKSTSMPDGVGIRASSLDDPDGFRPTMHVFTDSAPSWAFSSDALPKFARTPD